jgi:hypothetical protein
MKNSALEVLKANAISNIEKHLDLILAANDIAYDGVTAPVRKPQHRQLRSLERIDEKLGLLMDAMGLEAEEQPLVYETAKPQSEALEGEPADTEAPEAEQDEEQPSDDEEEEPAETE